MRLKISVEEPMPKQKPQKDVANHWKNLFHLAFAMYKTILKIKYSNT
jgi:hypothetical protein